MRNLIFCGDIHGEFHKLVWRLQGKKVTDSDIVICGDIGIGFDDSEQDLDNLSHSKKCKWFRNSGNKIYCVRGNHDDPDRFKELTQVRDFPIWLVPDYTLLELEASDVLCIGGGFSIDYEYRQMAGFGWWKGEMPKYNSEKLTSVLSKPMKSLCVATHSSPSFCPPYEKIPNARPCILEGCKKERDEMDLFFKHIDFQVPKSLRVSWYYGHFHMNQPPLIQDNFSFYHLNIMELREYLPIN